MSVQHQAEPLRITNGGPESPEALMISALLDTGEFFPEKYNLSIDDLSCWTQLWDFCLGYQRDTGQAPPRDLVALKFPDFERSVVSNPLWAAGQLQAAAAKRRLRSQLREALQALNDDDLEDAYAKLEVLERPRVVRKKPVGIWDQDDEEFVVSKLVVPYSAISRATGGIAPGELWYLGGRPGEGKTNTLCEYVARILESGPYTVRYASLEMPANVINNRVRRALATPAELKLLESPDIEERKRGKDELKERVPGLLHVFDPSHGRVTNALVHEHMLESDLTVIDHVGLMRSSDGRRAIEDWRVMATISNTLMDDKLATGTPVLAAVQLNRDRDVAQSDAILQDADVLIKLRRASVHVMKHVAEKVRNGPGITWFSRYDPARGNFEEISSETAHAIQLADDEAAAR